MSSVGAVPVCNGLRVGWLGRSAMNGIDVTPGGLRELASAPVGSGSGDLGAALRLRNETLLAVADQIVKVESRLRELRRTIRHAPVVTAGTDGHIPALDSTFSPLSLVAVLQLDEGGDPVVPDVEP